MPPPAVGVATLAVAWVVVMRWRARRRARMLEAAHAGRATGADGVIAGAEPIALGRGDGRRVLILHGFNDTPQSVEALAHALHASGWSVHAPLLPAHGRGARTLARQGRAREWIESARAEWRALSQPGLPPPALIGQSMGGALAVILASEAPPSALVLLAPYLRMGRTARLLSHVWPAWQLAFPVLFANPARGIRDAAARAAQLGSGMFTPRLVRELRRVVDLAWTRLGKVSVPALVVHSRSDYRIPSRSATRAFARLGGTKKALVWREEAGHVLSADVGREEVFALVLDWLQQHAAEGGGLREQPDPSRA